MKGHYSYQEIIYAIERLGQRLRAIELRLDLLEGNPERGWHTVDQMRLRYGVSRRTIYNWMEKGYLEVMRVPSGKPRVKWIKGVAPTQPPGREAPWLESLAEEFRSQAQAAPDRQAVPMPDAESSLPHPPFPRR